MYNIVIISRTHIQQVLLLVALLLVIAHRADEPVACYGHGYPPDPVVAMFVCEHATWRKALEYLGGSLTEVGLHKPVVGG